MNMKIARESNTAGPMQWLALCWCVIDARAAVHTCNVGLAQVCDARAAVPVHTCNGRPCAGARVAVPVHTCNGRPCAGARVAVPVHTCNGRPCAGVRSNGSPGGTDQPIHKTMRGESRLSPFATERFNPFVTENKLAQIL